jgi:DMSO/TMAO reductase YedYZ heme-binding membrane subunit
MKGWKLTIWISLGLVVLTGLQLAVWGSGEEGIRVLVRSSARSSVVLFALAFSASALRSLWQTNGSKWLLANRRYVGVSYAVSHALHAAALFALYDVSSEFAESLNAVTLVGGGLAYVFTLAMAVTSNDAAVRALGRQGWRRLHLVGGWYIWIIFAQSYLPRAVMDPVYLPAGAIVLAVPALRIAARARRRAALPHPA